MLALWTGQTIILAQTAHREARQRALHSLNRKDEGVLGLYRGSWIAGRGTWQDDELCHAACLHKPIGVVEASPCQRLSRWSACKHLRSKRSRSQNHTAKGFSDQEIQMGDNVPLVAPHTRHGMLCMLPTMSYAFTIRCLFYHSSVLSH